MHSHRALQVNAYSVHKASDDGGLKGLRVREANASRVTVYRKAVRAHTMVARGACREGLIGIGYGRD